MCAFFATLTRVGAAVALRYYHVTLSRRHAKITFLRAPVMSMSIMLEMSRLPAPLNACVRTRYACACVRKRGGARAVCAVVQRLNRGKMVRRWCGYAATRANARVRAVCVVAQCARVRVNKASVCGAQRVRCTRKPFHHVPSTHTAPISEPTVRTAITNPRRHASYEAAMSQTRIDATPAICADVSPPARRSPPRHTNDTR